MLLRCAPGSLSVLSLCAAGSLSVLLCCAPGSLSALSLCAAGSLSALLRCSPFQREIKLEVALEDWSRELPPSSQLFRPLRQKVYGLLFDISQTRKSTSKGKHARPQTLARNQVQRQTAKCAPLTNALHFCSETLQTSSVDTFVAHNWINLGVTSTVSVCM